MPILKSFLQDNDGSGADAYENLDVVFIRGRQAILTIYDVPDIQGESLENGERNGWAEKEKITLSDYKTRVRLYACICLCGSINLNRLVFRMKCMSCYKRRGEYRS